MTKKGIGTLANLAQILEDATDPESQVREDRRETKAKAQQKEAPAPRQKKSIDPKRKAWHERRLKEQAEGRQAHPSGAAPAAQAPTLATTQVATRTAAASASGGLQSALAAAKDAKPKDVSKRPEPWKRKPGDPFF
jgi:hypothetical protein